VTAKSSVFVNGCRLDAGLTKIFESRTGGELAVKKYYPFYMFAENAYAEKDLPRGLGGNARQDFRVAETNPELGNAVSGEL